MRLLKAKLSSQLYPSVSSVPPCENQNSHRAAESTEAQSAILNPPIYSRQFLIGNPQSVSLASAGYSLHPASAGVAGYHTFQSARFSVASPTFSISCSQLEFENKRTIPCESGQIFINEIPPLRLPGYRGPCYLNCAVAKMKIDYRRTNSVAA